MEVIPSQWCCGGEWGGQKPFGAAGERWRRPRIKEKSLALFFYCYQSVLHLRNSPSLPPTPTPPPPHAAPSVRLSRPPSRSGLLQPDSAPPPGCFRATNRRVICIFAHLTWHESSGLKPDQASSLSDHFINKKKNRKGGRAKQVSGEGSAESWPSGGGDKTWMSHTGPNLGPAVVLGSTQAGWMGRSPGDGIV